MSAQIITTIRYKDAPAAIEWLCVAFGFEKHLVVPGQNGEIVHAQLVFGNAMIMLGSLQETEYSSLVTVPANVNGRNTQAAYVIIENLEDHFLQAKTAGATIIQPITEQDYGGKLYTCTDLEGYLWNFGSYNPWKH